MPGVGTWFRVALWLVSSVARVLWGRAGLRVVPEALASSPQLCLFELGLVGRLGWYVLLFKFLALCDSLRPEHGRLPEVQSGAERASGCPGRARKRPSAAGAVAPARVSELPD